MEIRTVQVWRAQLERLGLIVTSQKTGRSSEFLVIRHPELREWAKQQNLLDLGPKRHKFRTFGRKGAKTKATASQLTPDSLPSESGFPPTEANPDSPITESKHNLVGNIGAETDLGDQKAEAVCSARNCTVQKEPDHAGSQDGLSTERERREPPANFQCLGHASWEAWLVAAFSGSPHIDWLMDQQEWVVSELGVNRGEAQRILEKCMRQARREDSTSKLPEIVAERIKSLSRR